jgi:Zn finger protein HypA/HybF involved in hydrogenase expression
MKKTIYKCRDCGKKIEEKDGEFLNGKLLKYKEEHSEEEHWIFKCNECFAKNTELDNFQDCEVYSRVVGYIRPIQQWHASKREEYRERKPFKIK